MNRFFSRIPVIAALTSIALGALVIVGWFRNMPLLKIIAPRLQTMQFSSAVCFVLSGAMLLLIVKARRGSDWARMLLPMTTLCLILLMIPVLGSRLLGFNINIESIFLPSTSDWPSLGTVAGFICLAITGLMTFTDPWKKTGVDHLGIAVAAIGGLALLGYVVSIPVLYYAFGNGLSTAMPPHNATLFLLLGLGLAVESKKVLAQENL